MKARCFQVNATLIALMLLTALTAPAEVSVELTINGDIDEIFAIIQHLRLMGLGGDFDTSDPLKLRVHSVHEESGPEEPSVTGGQETGLSMMGEEKPPPAEPGEPAAETDSAAQPPETAPEPEPTLALHNQQIKPQAVKTGETVRLTVEVIDKDHVIDTLAANIKGMSFTRDLYDNGTGEDQRAGDNIWTLQFTVPADAQPGNYDVTIIAYDVNGEPVITFTEDHRLISVTAVTRLTVLP
jgi:hypothetical protein